MVDFLIRALEQVAVHFPVNDIDVFLHQIHITIKQLATGSRVAHRPVLEQVAQYIREFSNTMILFVQFSVGNHPILQSFSILSRFQLYARDRTAWGK
jgi:hypothetical protein